MGRFGDAAKAWEAARRSTLPDDVPSVAGDEPVGDPSGRSGDASGARTTKTTKPREVEGSKAPPQLGSPTTKTTLTTKPPSSAEPDMALATPEADAMSVEQSVALESALVETPPAEMAAAQVAGLTRERQVELEARARRLSGETLFDLASAEGKPLAERGIYRLEIRSRADAILDEVEGSRPPPNPTVHAMFDEARARLGSRDLEERSITSWLRRHAPAVAALWPAAPVTASWREWREHIATQHVATLDEAWKGITQSKTPGKGVNG